MVNELFFHEILRRTNRETANVADSSAIRSAFGQDVNASQFTPMFRVISPTQHSIEKQKRVSPHRGQMPINNHSRCTEAVATLIFARVSRYEIG